MLPGPVAVGVTMLEDSPASSLSTEQEEAAPHAENCKPLVALQAIVAPLTGVTPSAQPRAHGWHWRPRTQLRSPAPLPAARAIDPWPKRHRSTRQSFAKMRRSPGP